MKWFAIFLIFTCRCDSAPLRNFNLAGTYTDRAVLIKIGDSEGSGFFLLTSNAVFLTTARHVLFDQQNNWHLFAPKATLSAFDSNGLPVKLEINCEALLNQKELRFTQAKSKDLALGRIEYCYPTNRENVYWNSGYVSFLTTNTTLNTIDIEGLLKFGDVTVGSDVMGYGFPTSIGLDENPQIDKYLPLLRKGIVAGINKDTKKLILDFPVYPGDSGGPVMLRQPDGLNYRFYCIGIQTEWVPFRDIVQSTRFKYLNQNLSNSGYSICEPADTILEMLW